MLLLLLHQIVHPLLMLTVHLGDHPVDLLLHLADLALLLHLQVRLSGGGHLLEGSLIIFLESRGRPLACKLGNRIRWVLPQGGESRLGGGAR